MPLPPYYLKVLLTGRMVCVVAMMMYRGSILQVLLESFSKGPGGFPYVFIITGKVTTLESIYGLTFVDHGVFVLWGDQQVFVGAITFEVGLCVILPTGLFNAFAETLCIRYKYMTFGFDFIGSGLGACIALAVGHTIGLTGRPVKPFFYLVQSLFRVFKLGECPFWDVPFLCVEDQDCYELYWTYWLGY